MHHLIGTISLSLYTQKRRSICFVRLTRWHRNLYWLLQYLRLKGSAFASLQNLIGSIFTFANFVCRVLVELSVDFMWCFALRFERKHHFSWEKKIWLKVSKAPTVVSHVLIEFDLLRRMVVRFFVLRMRWIMEMGTVKVRAQDEKWELYTAHGWCRHTFHE